MPTNEAKSWHIHKSEHPYCESWSRQTSAWNEELAINALNNLRSRGVQASLAGPYPFSSDQCPYRKEMAKKYGAPVPSQAVNLHEITCAECGEPMDAHEHPNKAGKTGAAAAPGRSTGPRKPPEVRPPCPHCGGPLHFNEGGGKVNFECLFRQYCVAAGRITDPLVERLPVAGHTDIAALGAWIDKMDQGKLRYGKMESPDGRASTFSGLRSNHKPVPSITEVAAAIVQEAQANAAPPPPEDNEAEKPNEDEERKKRRRELLKSAKRR